MRGPLLRAKGRYALLQLLFVLPFALSVLAAIRVFFRSRSDTALEVLALRQQVAALKRKRRRPTVNSWDRLFWTTLRRLWSRWTDVLVLVQPETVIGWHRAGFRLYWRWRSRPRGGRPRITAEIRHLIRRMAEENAGWGAPKIHGELLKLGFIVSERTVARYLRCVHRRGDPGKRWLTFLRNHREAIVPLDFFTVPTVTFQLLYCFFVIEHGRRKILHFSVTRHPTAEWVIQQLREAFPDAAAHHYVIFDHDSKFDTGVLEFLKATGLKPKRTSVQSPWQNGIAARVLGNWQFSGATVVQAGRPILISGPDNAGLLDFIYTNGRADHLRSGVISDPSKTKLFDTSAFRPAVAFTVPTDSLSQPDLRTPWRNAVKWSFFKNNPIKERYNIQFRTEFYNIFNTPQFDVRGASTDVTNPLYGQITEGGGPRNIQFSVRVLF